MRQIRSSGGIEMGPPEEGPWIDVFSVTGEPVTLGEAAAASMSFGNEWSVASGSFLPKGMRGWVGIGEKIVIRFALPTNMVDVVAALRTIEQYEDGKVPGALIGASLAAARAKKFPQTASPAMVAMVVQSVWESGKISSVNSNQIQAAAASFIQQLPVAKLGAVDLARVMLEAGRQLWGTDVARLVRLGKIKPDKFSFTILGPLAWTHLELQGRRFVEVDGMPINFESASVWSQVMEIVSQSAPKEIVRFLLGNEISLRGWPTLDFSSSDNALLRGITQSLAREAAQKRRYIPNSRFVLLLPPSHPFYQNGIPSLRVSADGNGLWTAMLNADEQAFAVLRWQPDNPLRQPWSIPEEWLPITAATMAALWRDLAIVSDEAIPKIRPVRSGSGQTEREHSTAALLSRSARYIRHRTATETRYRIWGSESDRQAILLRRAHGVSGHLRLLPPGWRRSKDAEMMADEYQIVLPDGYTFVRPHTRGGDTAAANAPDVKARGLATLLTLAAGKHDDIPPP